MTREEIKNIISKMKLKEKAAMCSGSDFWTLESLERLGIPSAAMSDGPFGVRKQNTEQDNFGINESEPAVCFPAGCALGSSFSPETARKMGEALGEESRSLDVNVLLGPALNIKRSPLCGRNFEYYSEDPLVSGLIGRGWIEGLQSRGVGASPKHYLANSQENKRMVSSSNMDERTLREIYMPAFERVVREAKPWTVMSSYNKLNGTYVSESREYLTDVLRGEWGFDGCVVSDWGAVNDRVRALEAGLDLEMPTTLGKNDRLIFDAVLSGELKEEVLDQALERILALIFRSAEAPESGETDWEAHHQLAEEIEEDCIVLLKNENEILPLSKDRKIAFIGSFAEKPRYQGTGSSHINSMKVVPALEAAAAYPDVQIVYAKGYDADSDTADEALIDEAVCAAEDSDCAVIFAGLPDRYESEGYDRFHMRMPEDQNELIRRVAEVQPETIVVLHNGAPVEMPWIDEVKGVIETYLGGEAVGTAELKVLFGDAEPGGRLAETFPLRLEDTPCYLSYGGEGQNVAYPEGVFVGYRYYLSKKMPVLFPFGHGLSYTQFEYRNLRLSKSEMTDRETLSVSVDITNTGSRTGKEVVQLYTAPERNEMIRPVRELRAFEKVQLEPGETENVTFELTGKDFSYWSEELHDYRVENGVCGVQIGRSSENILLEEPVRLISTTEIPIEYSLNSTIGEILSHPKGKMVADLAASNYVKDGTVEDLYPTEEVNGISPETIRMMVDSVPLRQILSYVPILQREQLELFLKMLNYQV